MADNEAPSSHEDEDKSNITNTTIGIYELSANEAKETFGEDGACFFVVANIPQKRSRVVSAFIEENIPQCSTALSSPQQPLPSRNEIPSPTCIDTFVMNCTTTDDFCSLSHTADALCVMTNEHSVSSGVGSVESSELNSPNPSATALSTFSTNSSNSTTLLFENHNNQMCDRKINNNNNNETFLNPTFHKDNSYTSSNVNSSTTTNGNAHNDSGCVIGCDDLNKDRQRVLVVADDLLNVSNCTVVTEFDTTTTHSSDSRRESGISSMNSSSLLHCSTPPKTTCSPHQQHSTIAPPLSTNRPLSTVDIDKEVLLCRIKRDLYDPCKEEQMLNLRQILHDSGCGTFTEQIAKCDWTPLLSRNNKGTVVHHPYIKGVLKKTRMTLLEEIQARHALKKKTVEATAKRETRVVCSLKRKELVKVIQQVRQCLRFAPCSSVKLLERPFFKCQFQIHQKIKLKRFSLPPSSCKEVVGHFDQDNVDSSSSLIERLELAESLSCKSMKEAAGKGDIKKILSLMNSNECTHKKSDRCQKMPAFHDALRKEHFRTAILLLEAGTDMKLYTEQRINEFNEMMDVVDRNRHAFTHQTI